VHAVPDPRDPESREVVWPEGLPLTLIVDRDGTRPTAETDIEGFGMIRHLLDAPGQQLFAIFPAHLWSASRVHVPAYNWARLSGTVDQPVSELSREDLENANIARRYASISALATGEGIEKSGLAKTLRDYDAFVMEGVDAEHHKSPEFLMSFGHGPFVVLRLVPGTAKSFGGAKLDQQARVLDTKGEPIARLYAAGEAAGMLGTDAIGRGFSGSATACYLTGRVAGTNAAKEALSRSD
jgi:hypothetical protein